MRGHLCTTILCAAVLAASPAGAAVTKGQGRCQSSAAKAALANFTTEAALLADCNDAIGRGSLPLVTDCRSQAASALADAASEFSAAITDRCVDADVDSLRYAGACETAASAADLVACLPPTQQAQTDAFLARLYSDSTLPTGDGVACREAISGEARKFAAKSLGTLTKCKNLASKDKIAVGTRCEDNAAYLEKVAKLRAKLEKKVTTACPGASLSNAALGDGCDAAASAAEVATCVQDGIVQMQAALAPAEYGDGGLCGDAHNAVEGRVQDTIDALSLAQKLRFMAGAAFSPDGGATFTAATTSSAGNIPALGFVDGPRGVGKAVGNATAFPVGMARGATWDTELERRVGDAIGVETRAKGVSVILGPVTAVVRNPRWGRSQESYGEDPVHLGAMGTAFVQGAQQHVMASVKHFAVNSIEDVRYSVNILIDERTLREIYLPHFRKVVTDGQVATVMSAYNAINGEHCDANSHLLTDILKDDWGFRGFVESDWLLGTHDTVNSALAGLDMEMPLARYFSKPNLEAALDSNEITLSLINESTRRKLRQVYCFRFDTDPPVIDASAVETPAHVALTREVEDEAIVLLKNQGSALPIGDSPAPTIAVVGALADLVNLGDNGSSDVTPSSAVTVLEGITARNASGSVVYITGDPNEPTNAAAIAGADAAVVVTGMTKDDEGESYVSAGDRDTYDLPTDRQQLIHDVAALSSRTIVVLEGGSAIGVDGWIDEVEALVMAWYPGMEGGTAIADILFGDVNPSGRLPLVWAKTDADLPSFPAYPPDNATDLFIDPSSEVPKDFAYGYYHGYRLLDHDSKDPRFPFGFGLSYTSYSYSNLALASTTLHDEDTLDVTFDVTNTGAVAGDEVAQLYVSYPGTAIDRPVRDLRAFERVALAPGQTKQVRLTVPVQDLAWYDEGLPGWSIEHVMYGVEVGSSSRDLPLSATFDVTP